MSYYIVSFVLFFFIFLFGFAWIHADLEAKRAEVMFGESYKGLQKLKSIVRGDTFWNSIRGRARLPTHEFVKEAATYHEVFQEVFKGACDVIREMIRNKVSEPGLEVRVSISALTPDGQRLRYVAKDPHSYSMHFDTNSVAWFATMLGEPRWYLKGWKDDPKKLLLKVDEELKLPEDFKNALDKAYAKKAKKVTFPLEIPFIEFWMGRREDYEAFLMIPVPLRERHLHPREQRGAIHVSFQKAEKFTAVFGSAVGEPCLTSEQADGLFREPIGQVLRSFSNALWPMVEKYKFETRDYGKILSTSSDQ